MRQFTTKSLKRLIFGIDNVIVYEFQFADLNHDWVNPHQVYFEQYRIEDTKMLEKVLMNIEFNLSFSMEEVSLRIKDGHLFYVAKKGGDIIGFVWYFVNRGRIRFPNVTLYLSPNEVFAANAYIRPDYRGLGILNYMRAFAYNDMKKKGFSRAFTLVLEKNRAAIKMHQKWGSVPISVVKYFSLLTLQFHYTNLKTNKIVFHDGMFVNWINLFHKIKKQ